MNYQAESLSQSDLWASTADLNILHKHLLDLFLPTCLSRRRFILSSGQASSYLINGKQVTLNPQGALAIGRILLSRLPEDTQAVAG